MLVRTATHSRQSQKAFTLVELSIVLVIIGLIIGGVLGGQQVIQNARLTNALNAIQAYQSQYQTYVQNYGAVPGNDLNATGHFGTSAVNGSGGGILVGAFDSTDCTTSGTKTETCLLWEDLRLANLVKSSSSILTQQPANPFGGVYGFQSSAFSAALSSPVICLSNVPASAAQAIDQRLDDGISNGGSVQAMAENPYAAGSSIAGTVATNYSSAQNYTVCVKM